MADYIFLVEKDGAGQTGLLGAGTPPAVTVYLKRDSTSAGTAPTLVEIGGGFYYVSVTVPDADVLRALTIDFDPSDALSLETAVRFQSRIMRPEDPYLDDKVSDVKERTDNLTDNPADGPTVAAAQAVTDGKVDAVQTTVDALDLELDGVAQENGGRLENIDTLGAKEATVEQLKPGPMRGAG